MGSTGFSASSSYTPGDSPVQKFGKSIGGVFLGILFIPAAFIVVYLTESRRERAPIVRKLAKPTDPASPAQGFVKFTAKPEGTPVTNENVPDPLVRFEQTEQKWVLGTHEAVETEKIKRGDREDEIKRKINYSDFSWVKEGEPKAKTMESIAFGSIKATLGGAVEWMGEKDLHDGPSRAFLRTLEDSKTVAGGFSIESGVLVRLEGVRGARWTGRTAPNRDRFSGSSVDSDRVVAYKWRREATTSTGERREVAREEWIPTEGRFGGYTVRFQDAFALCGWREIYVRDAGTVRLESGEEASTKEILDAVDGAELLLVGKSPRAGEFSAYVVSTLSWDRTLDEVNRKSTIRGIEDARKVEAAASPEVGTIVRLDGLRDTRWTAREPVNRSVFSGTSVDPDRSAAYRWKRVITFAKEKRSIKRNDWSGTECPAGGFVIRADDALFYGWDEVYSRDAGSWTSEDGKSYGATEVLEVVGTNRDILVIGKVVRPGEISALVVSSLDFAGTMSAVKDMKRPTAGTRRVTVKGIPFGPPLFVVGDVSGQTIGKGPTDLYIISGLSEEETIRALAGQDFWIKWAGRIGGFLLLWIGMLLIGGPVSSFLEIFPVVGGMMGRASGCVMGLITFPIAAVLIVLEVLLIKIWFVFLALLLLAAVIGIMRRKRAAPVAA